MATKPGEKITHQGVEIEFDQGGETRFHATLGFVVEMPVRKFLAQCEDGEQLYLVTEGRVPDCPQCRKIMRVLHEVK